ncbi:NAD-dependent epimerase/dehydratase family protein [Alphaproteobacteria bacterium]|nr:NAD-dependent epimerase/dehydratase family protein [Alphaproteobacteria bacterium]
MKTKLVAVTGANGFVGYNLCIALEKLGYKVIRISRGSIVNSNYDISISSWNDNINWKKIFNNVDFVIHCAGIAHRSNIKQNSQIYEISNHALTKKIFLAAKKMNVKKFIFLSTIKVNGDLTINNRAFKYNDKPNPSDAYGLSKFNAEKSIINMSKGTTLRYVIVRPSLIYGNHIKGNLLKLLKIINAGIPLPFAKIKNERSFLSIDNLIDFVLICLNNEKADNKIFLISDSKPISTSDLIELIAKGLNKKIILFYLPLYFIRIMSKIVNQPLTSNSLICSMKVDVEYTKTELSWSPKITTEKGIIDMVENWVNMQVEKKNGI